MAVCQVSLTKFLSLYNNTLQKRKKNFLRKIHTIPHIIATGNAEVKDTREKFLFRYSLSFHLSSFLGRFCTLFSYFRRLLFDKYTNFYLAYYSLLTFSSIERKLFYPLLFVIDFFRIWTKNLSHLYKRIFSIYS